MNLDKPLFIAAGTSMGPLPGKWASWGSPPDWRTVDTSPCPRLTLDPKAQRGIRNGVWQVEPHPAGYCGACPPSGALSCLLGPRIFLFLSLFWFRALNHLSCL